MAAFVYILLFTILLVGGFLVAVILPLNMVFECYTTGERVTWLGILTVAFSIYAAATLTVGAFLLSRLHG